MNEASDRETLLNDILSERDPVDLRDALLSRTLHHVRRRRIFHRVRRASSVLAAAAALGFLVWRLALPNAPGPQQPGRPYALVRTQPLPASALVKTQPLVPASLVASIASPKIVIIATHLQDPFYREIDDAELLALAGTNAAVLVRLGPHSAELVFASGVSSNGRTDIQ